MLPPSGQTLEEFAPQEDRVEPTKRQVRSIAIAEEVVG
jgi:hypothetical protein